VVQREVCCGTKGGMLWYKGRYVVVQREVCCGDD